MNILDTIIATKHAEVAALKKQGTTKYYEQQPYFERGCISLLQKFDTTKIGVNIIAEYKRQSPSKGIINAAATVQEVTLAYQQFGAVCCSILTDEQYFGGSLNDILDVREQLNIPILRKDFIINEIQILEAKAIGADVILLIAACLTPKQVKQLSTFACSLGLQVLLELHAEVELNHICDTVHFVGINNRNLKTFEVDLKQSIYMQSKIGNDYITIAESGIDSIDSLQMLQSNGFDGFLMGELFMKQTKPGLAFELFCKALPK